LASDDYETEQKELKSFDKKYEKVTTLNKVEQINTDFAASDYSNILNEDYTAGEYLNESVGFEQSMDATAGEYSAMLRDLKNFDYDGFATTLGIAQHLIPQTAIDERELAEETIADIDK
jgi:hypothetical protein